MFKVLDQICQPTRATKYSAMVDLYANDDVVIGAGETKIVLLGVKIDKQWFDKLEFLKTNKELAEYKSSHISHFMRSNYLELHPRSSLRAKGLIVGVGVIDLDYPDEIGLIVHNPLRYMEAHEHDSYSVVKPYTIKKGDKIAQCTLKEHKGYLLGIESDTERTGGFGSSDK